MAFGFGKKKNLYKIIDNFLDTKFSHEYCYTIETLKNSDINVVNDIPEYINNIHTRDTHTSIL